MKPQSAGLEAFHNVPVEDDTKSESTDCLCLLTLLTDAESDLHERNKGVCNMSILGMLKLFFPFNREERSLLETKLICN